MGYVQERLGNKMIPLIAFVFFSYASMIGYGFADVAGDTG